MSGDAQTGQEYSWLPRVKGSFHRLSHHLHQPTKREQYEESRLLHTEQMAWFLGRVKSLDEGGTFLLDNSIFLFGSSLKDGNRQLEENPPLLVARCAPERKRMGIIEKSFGDSTGPLEGLS